MNTAATFSLQASATDDSASELPLFDDFRSLVLDDISLIDVRAPVEFNEGAFETAVNLPLMNDEERRLVGIKYKHEGAEAALALGHKLVDGELKATRVDLWSEFVSKHPECAIYCFRGGRRSRISQRWLFEATGKVVPRLDGGYKAFRRFLIDSLETLPSEFTPIVLGGRTGSGKTILLNEFQDSVDLEGLAAHRGSSFGRRVSPQPTQINFENNLAFKLIKLHDGGIKKIIVEDESRNIGRRMVPKPFFTRMETAPVVVLETPFERRVQIIFDEYATIAQKEFAEAVGKENALDAWAEAMSASLARIKKRLGGKLHDSILKDLIESTEIQRKSGDAEPHKRWMATLLKEYYDPMYDYQIARKSERVVFRGSPEEIRFHLADSGLR